MARRTFDVIDVTEIFVHWDAGRSLNEMSGSLGIDRKTIRKYLAPAVEAGITMTQCQRHVAAPGIGHTCRTAVATGTGTGLVEGDESWSRCALRRLA